MSKSQKSLAFYAAVGLLSIASPFMFANYISQLTMLWVMVLFAITWDSMGGQMGYNSLGNIFFFGVGMYISAIVQIGLQYDVAEYTAAYGGIKVDFTEQQYLTGMALGTVVAAIGSVLCAIVLSRIVFGLRGPYFAIGTLGIALAAGELFGAWEYVGAGSGISLPVYPGDPDVGGLFFYYAFFIAAALSFFFFRWLYTTRFGLAINAIRDDEEKAEAMGVRTMRYKTITWSFSAFFLGICGSLFGNFNIFIEPLEVAFATIVFGIPMVVMSLLGGKGTLWGPVIGAILYHVIKEATWTYLLGWQWVALGLLIIISVVFFQQGIMGWAQDKWPELFGIEVEDAAAGRRRGGGVMAEMIEVRNVSKAFGGVQANQDVSMDVTAGGITGLIGPNGSGKTTLFNSIVGYHPIDGGSIKFEDQEISSFRVPQIARLGLLRTFQQTRIYGNMNCVKNMLISVPHRTMGFFEIFGDHSAEELEKAEHLLEFVGLYGKRKLMAGDLSFGQQKLLEFAMALMNGPKVLLLDEPTAGINPTLINGLIDRLKRANEEFGITLFVIEHNMRVIMNLAEHIYCMAHGEMLAEGTPDTIRNDQRVIDAYLGAH